MGVSGWWLYDLVVIAVAVLCIWNGTSSGIIRSAGGLVIGIVSCLLASLLSGPVADAAYDAFFKDSCQEIVTAQLEKNDITGEIRNRLQDNGIYLPYDNSEMADMIESFSEDDSALEYAAAMFGFSPDEFKNTMADAVAEAVESNSEIIPDWAEKAIKKDDGTVDVDAAADTVVAILRNDYEGVSASLERTVVKPVVTGALRVVAFSFIAALLSFIMRAALLVLPQQKNTPVGMALGAVMGAARAGIYIFLIVLLVSGIVSMQNGEYPFYTQEAIDKTCLFRIFYNMWN